MIGLFAGPLSTPWFRWDRWSNSRQEVNRAEGCAMWVGCAHIRRTSISFPCIRFGVSSSLRNTSILICTYMLVYIVKGRDILWDQWLKLLLLMILSQPYRLSRAVIRSVVKNFSLTFLFPICFTLFSFQHNRTVYDIIAGSIVVEERPNQRRRMNNNAN